MKTVEFTAMKDGTEEEYLFLKPLEDEHVSHTADRVIRELRLQEEETLPGYKISRLEHGLQAATRALNLHLYSQASRPTRNGSWWCYRGSRFRRRARGS